MPHLRTTNARSLALHGVTFTSFVSSASGAARLAAWRADFHPETPGQAHTMSEEETFYVLAGNLDVELGDDHFRATAGDAVLVPAGAVFKVSNNTTEPAQAWVTSLLGMKATLHPAGQEITPPWAQ